MRFHVLGIGPLGSLVAHHLRRAIPPTHSITLLYNKPRTARHAPQSFHIQTGGSLTASSGFLHETFETSDNKDLGTAAQSNESIDSLFVTTRAPSTLHTIRKLYPRLSPNSTIVLVQNGLGVYEELIQNVFRNPQERPHFIFASSTHAMFFPSSSALFGGRSTLLHPEVGHVEFAIVPDLYGRNFEAGFLDENVHASERRARLSDITTPEDPQFERYQSLRNTVAALLLAEPLNAHWKSLATVQLALRRKLVVQSVIHPLTAIMGCRNGDVFSSENAVRIAARLCREASDVYGAQIREETKAWLAASDSDMGGLLGIARLPRALDAQSLTRECLRISQTSQGAVSNMLSALRAGKRTEIDYLNGYLVKLGKTYDVPMPANATIYNLVRMRSALPIDQIL
ncbi:ketopantoate reductase-like protein [Mycena maculata]|uniref:Ketopantoate reductase-like protein n=1 Tax=Mycena maculata TaxID=230809 RepID=A0AAD7MQV3_9AGAR|nr:ketopantoate reductase-like protein [Mycena maculata]